MVFVLSNGVQILISLITWQCSLRQLQNVIFLICLIFLLLFLICLFAFEEMTVPSGHLWRNLAILRGIKQHCTSLVHSTGSYFSGQMKTIPLPTQNLYTDNNFSNIRKIKIENLKVFGKYHTEKRQVITHFVG